MDRTTNYNLKKPSTGDPVLVGDLNDNMDVIDTQLNAVTDGLAIIANGNTHAAIAKDQAVFVKNHSSLANGLYWATAAISANGALSTSNLTADTSGGLNKLHDDITTLNSNLGIVVRGDVEFTNGGGTKSVAGVTTNSRLIAQRRQGSPTSIILTATCSSNGTVTFGAYDASSNGSNYTGTLTGVILMYDNR